MMYASPGASVSLLEGEVAGQLGVVPEWPAVPGPACVRDRVQDAHLTGPDLADFGAAPLEGRGDLHQVLGSLGVGHPGPRAVIESLACGGDRPIHILRLGLGYPEEHVLGAGVDDVELVRT
jgi:hypothetical protein